MRKTIVAAKSDNNVIGKDQDLVWHLPADLAFFKNIIAGQWLLTGRTSFENQQGEEIFNDPEKAIVLTGNKDYTTPRARVAHSIEEAFALARQKGAKEIFILGGGGVYRQTIDLADKLIITEVHGIFEGDAFFPKIDPRQWKEISRKEHQADEENMFNYSFVIYQRK